MGVTGWLADLAARRVHVLVVEAPGVWVVRAGVETEVVRRGWRLAWSPADADVLLVCGAPGPETSAVVEALWDAMPGPRVRSSVTDTAGVTAVLDDLSRQLSDTAGHRQDASTRPTLAAGEGHEMAPDGIPLASGGPDRDGLEMDVLHLPLGPVLPHWPVGLVLTCALQGDLVTRAEGRFLDGAADGGPAPDPRGPDRAARACDRARDVLALAGWEQAATSARQTRDLLLAGADPQQGGAAVAALRDAVARSRLLRWSLRGDAVVGTETLDGLGLPEAAAGDAHDRLLALLDHAQDLLTGDLTGDLTGAAESVPVLSVSPAAMARLVTGLDLATARLLVAGVEVAPSPEHAGTTRD